MHAGVWIATSAQLETALKVGCLSNSYTPHWFYGPLEAAASELYYRCDMMKVVPVEDIESFAIHHMPDKFIQQSSERDTAMTMSQLSRWASSCIT